MLAISQLRLPKICQETHSPGQRGHAPAYPVSENTAVAVPYRTPAVAGRRRSQRTPATTAPRCCALCGHGAKFKAFRWCVVLAQSR